MKHTKSFLFSLVLLSAGVLLSANTNIPESDPSSPFSVERNKESKSYLLTTTQPSGDWVIYAGTTPQNITQKVVSGSGSTTITTSEYPAETRMYFKCVWEDNASTIASERLLPMEGAYNVRDLGGYKASNGKVVIWDKVFRSGDLNTLTSNDLNYLSGIGLKSVVDFRGDAERENAPDKTPSTVVNRYAFPIETGNLLNITHVTTLEQAELLLVDGNKFFVTDCQEQYTKFFQVLMNGDNVPLLFHCSAGKDRTGFAAALFLSSLGVDRETIIRDYLLSGDYVNGKYAPYVAANPILAPLFSVKRAYIMAAFDLIDTQYNGMDSFLKNQLGVDLDTMRTLYTE